MNIAFALYILKNFAESFYSLWKRKKMDLINIPIIVNLLGFCLSILWTVRYYTHWSVIDADKLDNPDMIDVEILKKINNDDTISLYIIMAMLLGIQWMRAIFAFQINRFFGPLLAMIT